MIIELTEAEKGLKNLIEDRVNKARMAFASHRLNEELDTWIQEAGLAAHRLHLSLKDRGHEPRHHGYMIENRGMPADDPQFYMHFHPLEDLLSFLHNPHANDDPEDRTLGEEFTFSVYSKRWGRDDTYRITRTEVGWDVRHLMIGGPCDKGGRPFLYENFRQDQIQFPSDLGGWLEWLWEQSAEQGLSREVVQAALQELADWVSNVERNRPAGDIWFGY